MYKKTFKMIDGDICIENGGLVLVDEQEELRQNTENRLSINVGEWFLDLELGLKYRNIQGKGKTDRDIELAMRECVLQDDRIQNIELISVDRNIEERVAVINIKIIENDGNEQYLKEVVDIG